MRTIVALEMGGHMRNLTRRDRKTKTTTMMADLAAPHLYKKRKGGPPAGVVDDYSGTNWRRQNPGSLTTSNAGFSDFLQGEAFSLPAVPTPSCQGTSTTTVEHWGQEWWIGSLTTGSGVRVQTDTLQKYLDHALHLNIVSPAP